MKAWQIEQAITEVLIQLRKKLNEMDRETEYVGAVLRVVVNPDMKVATDFKMIQVDPDGAKRSVRDGEAASESGNGAAEGQDKGGVRNG